MLTIRTATRDDLPAVAAIYAHYVTETVVTFDENPPALDAWHDRHADLSTRGLPFLIAEAEGEVAGYAYATPWRPKPAYRHTVEDSIYLSPAWSGRGFGSALLQAVLDACTDAGLHQVIAVIVDPGSDASAALHRKHGFTEVGRLQSVGHKHNRWLDTVLMQRTLRDRR
ncbi:GNAT family N-acetyltransferase [Dactylosporangium matsuzakiense]|uniref:N-acetyltransferase n=1 Tax=Dactylosporangium matsuzakiense TaxID=53360 RepID=A0A9W6KMK8_9ACTN|nr:GNAT family N-acetyltransferase [Dactylosporangium matsuzakiense]UWZ40992.1 N-acetyltransferase [Dactylosporangium matsuzakiense]GLL04801.1 N-acetyltransferase [Dactylosporangium matsuzakiense]